MEATVSRIVALCILLFNPVCAIKLWDSANAIPSTVPESCRAALAQDIGCDNRLVTASQAASRAVLVGELAAEYCTSICHDSIEDFRTKVTAECGSKEYVLYANSTLKEAPADLANGLSWAYRLSCVKDE
jgi:hypothetical protein